jgi:hypothetical protein
MPLLLKHIDAIARKLGRGVLLRELQCRRLGLACLSCARPATLASAEERNGGAYRVVYGKPFEDPRHRIDERMEILADGALLPLPPFHDPFPARFCQRIVSGGQTGADRAGLDFAMRHDYPHGGWAPHGRKAKMASFPANTN